jgi:hypothetical protein
MKRAGFLRSPGPDWALDSRDVSSEAALLAERAVKLFETRKLIWKVNLTLIGVLIATHVSWRFLVPGFPAAWYLGIEIGVLEAVSTVVTRRMTKKEAALKRQYLERTESHSGTPAT